MVYTVWKNFPVFFIPFIITKMLLYIEFRVFWKEKKKGIRGVEDHNGLLPTNQRSRQGLVLRHSLARDESLVTENLRS